MKANGSAAGKATIYDVAKLAGVNASTVSRALGKPERVSAATRRLVEEAAAKLNFTVNPLARVLPTGRTGTIGLIVADITNPSYFDIIRGAQAAAAASNFHRGPGRIHRIGHDGSSSGETIAADHRRPRSCQSTHG